MFIIEKLKKSRKEKIKKITHNLTLPAATVTLLFHCFSVFVHSFERFFMGLSSHCLCYFDIQPYFTSIFLIKIS